MSDFNKFHTPVLVVDDHPMMQEMLSHIIKQLGFPQVFLADNGNTAWPILMAKNIGLVLTDLNMPVLDGIELIKSIRENPLTKDLPVVVISCEGVPDKVMEAIKAGADAFVVKPFSVETVKAKIVQALSRRRDQSTAD